MLSALAIVWIFVSANLPSEDRKPPLPTLGIPKGEVPIAVSKSPLPTLGIPKGEVPIAVSKSPKIEKKQ